MPGKWIDGGYVTDDLLKQISVNETVCILIQIQSHES